MGWNNICLLEWLFLIINIQQFTQCNWVSWGALLIRVKIMKQISQNDVFELVTQKCLYKFFRFTNSTFENIKWNVDWLTQSINFFFGPHSYPEGSYEVGSVRPSLLPSVLSSLLLSILPSVQAFSWSISKFWHVARNPYEVVHDKVGSSWKKILNCENQPKMGQKQDFLKVLKNFVINFYWICSIMKMYIICYVPAQIPYLEKFWLLRYGPKCSQPIRFQEFLINHISRTSQWNSLSFCMLIQIHIN